MNAPKFKIKEILTTPVLKMSDGVTYYIKVQSEMYQGKGLDGREAPTMVRAINLETGELCDVILNTITRERLADRYSVLTGKCFAIVKRSLEGKKYKSVDLAEIEDPAAGAETAEETASAHQSMKAGKKAK